MGLFVLSMTISEILVETDHVHVHSRYVEFRGFLVDIGILSPSSYQSFSIAIFKPRFVFTVNSSSRNAKFPIPTAIFAQHYSITRFYTS